MHHDPAHGKRKRKRSDSVLWQKPIHQQKCHKGKDYTAVADRLRTVRNIHEIAWRAKTKYILCPGIFEFKVWKDDKFNGGWSQHKSTCKFQIGPEKVSGGYWLVHNDVKMHRNTSKDSFKIANRNNTCTSLRLFKVV